MEDKILFVGGTWPSFRDGNNIFVSRRNVNKEYITIEEFVPTYLKDDKLYYVGDYKPSVDSPIQVRLYNVLPNINYMIHSHCYVDGAPFTDEVLPCGAIEEIDEIINTIKDNYYSLNKNFYAVNLAGHGSIMMSKDVEQLKNINISGRKLPEKQKVKK